eukprot:6198960-Pleurochrysis_carterae.AAC.2
MWCLDREACMAIALAEHEDGVRSLKIALHTYKPALRLNGRHSRPPEAQEGDSMAKVRPKRHSVEVDSQSWFTDSSESRKVGTQRTLRKVRRCVLPCESTALMGMSPMSDIGCGLPSTPAMTSSVLRVLMRLHACGCMCHVHPLSNTNVMPLCPLPRAWRLASRRSRPAESARADAAGPRATRGERGDGTMAGGGLSRITPWLESWARRYDTRARADDKPRAMKQAKRTGSSSRANVSTETSWTIWSTRRKVEPEATKKESAETSEAAKVRAHCIQQMSMVIRVGRDAFVLRCDRFNTRAPKDRYPYTEARVRVRIVEQRRASANSESEERRAESSADAKGAGS